MYYGKIKCNYFCLRASENGNSTVFTRFKKRNKSIPRKYEQNHFALLPRINCNAIKSSIFFLLFWFAFDAKLFFFFDFQKHIDCLLTVIASSN